MGRSGAHKMNVAGRERKDDVDGHFTIPALAPVRVKIGIDSPRRTKGREGAADLCRTVGQLARAPDSGAAETGGSSIFGFRRGVSKMMCAGDSGPLFRRTSEKWRFHLP